MISMQTSQDHHPIELGASPHGYREQCQRQVAEAEKEMGAFVIAVGRMRGVRLPPALQRSGSSWRGVSASCLWTAACTGAN